MSKRDLEATLVAVDTTEFGYEQLDETRDAPNGPYVEEQFINRNKVDASDLLEWHIRGIWYIDKRQGDLRYRLLGIAPVLKSARCKINPDNEAACAPIELFWVWYPGAREILNKALSFNRKNTSQPVSFDHLLNSRRFSAMIYKEDNVQGDRAVADYINENALMQLLESDRIKDQIRNIEIDLWNY
jgi:gliding motility associated protien GldN